MKPTALYFDIMKYQEDNLQLLKDNFNIIVLNNPNENTKNILNTVDVLFAPLGYYIGEEYMNNIPKLRAIVSNTTGIPHIDENVAINRGVEICALHNEQEFLNTITPTAEHTVGMILAAHRRMIAAHNYVISGKWDRRPWGVPTMLSRMSVGILGYGRLGKKVAKIMKSMGTNVNYFDPNVSGGVDTLNELLVKSNILSINAVANDSTKGLINIDAMSIMPPNSIIVNTARGEILDTDALLKLLKSGHIFSAALDTIDGEYQSNFESKFRKSRLLEYARNNDNLILTPHIGGSTVDAWFETERRVIEKAISIFR
jgi:phosphoglycerate dehydrogenase-like enzyme